MLTRLLRASPTATLVLGAVVALVIVWRVLATSSWWLFPKQYVGDPVLREITRDGEAPPQDVLWRERIVADPTNAMLFIALATSLEAQGNLTDATAAVEEALRLDTPKPDVSLEAARFFLRNGDVARGLAILDRRTNLYPDLAADAFPIFLAALAWGPPDADTLVALAGSNPRWYGQFFLQACTGAVGTGTLEQLYDARAQAGVLGDAERRCMVERMKREGRWADARRLWQDSLPAAQRGDVQPVFNGDFERAPSNFGFDWIVAHQDRVQVTTEPAAGARGRALHVAYHDRRYGGPPIAQTLMLGPGSYTFEGRGRADGFESWLGLQWGLYCAPNRGAPAVQLVRTEPFVGLTEWQPFAEPFAVPERGCPVQFLQLELANPKRDATTAGSVVVRLRGALWFDDLRIVPTE